MIKLSKFFQWYHGAPVEGKVVGATTKTPLYAEEARHVDASLLKSGESYAYVELVHPLTPPSAIGVFGIGQEFKAESWGKVTEVTPQQSGMANGDHKVTLEFANGRTLSTDITNITKCIPHPK